jgi:hypothetical protein
VEDVVRDVFSDVEMASEILSTSRLVVDSLCSSQVVVGDVVDSVDVIVCVSRGPAITDL